MPSPEKVLDFDPTRPALDSFITNILPTFSDRVKVYSGLSQIPGEHTLTDESSIELPSGSIHVTQNYIKREENDLVTLRKIEDLGKAKKLYTLRAGIVNGIAPGRSLIRQFISGSNYRSDISTRALSYEYYAGKIDEETGKIEPEVASKTLVLAENIKGDSKISEIDQVAEMVNPYHKDTYGALSATFEGSMINNVFSFDIQLDSAILNGDEISRATLRRSYEPQRFGERIIYVGENVTQQIKILADKPMRVETGEFELKQFRSSRATLARLNRYMPRRFTPDQVEMMVGNILEGKIANAGVWDQLAIPFTRRESLRTNSSDTRSEMRQSKNAEDLSPESAPGNN